MLKKFKRKFAFFLSSTLTVLTALHLVSCNVSVNSDENNGTDNTKNGRFQDSYVEGLEYSTTSGLSGKTDSSGTFKYKYGDEITFKIGNVILGKTDAKSLITPTDLTQNQDRVLLISSFLIYLDEDGNPDNSIKIDRLKKHNFENMEKIDLTSDDINRIKSKLSEEGVDFNIYKPVAEEHLKNTYWNLLDATVSSLNGSTVSFTGDKNMDCKFTIVSKDDFLKEINVRLENCSGLPNNTYDVKFSVGINGIPYYTENSGLQNIVSVIEPEKNKLCFNTSSYTKTCMKKSINNNDNNQNNEDNKNGCCSFTGSLSCEEINQVLARVNSIRDEVGVPHLSWDCDLAEGSQSWAVELSKKGRLEHSHGNYGENLYWASYNSDVIAAVNAWYSEKPNFVYGKSDWCKDGTVCGHYTQLIWKDSKYIGCGIVRGSGGTYVACRFYPPGNVIGQQPY